MGSRGRLMLLLAALPAAAETHFDHVHVNASDPEASVRFYISKFQFERGKWLLFDKRKPKAGVDSPIWHVGWGAEDMQAEYKRQVDSGTKFHTPITDISDLANSPGIFYAYVEGPDGELIELNTARHHHFGHLHLFSADAAAAAVWYAKYFGVKPRLPRSPEPRMYKGLQVGPSASFTIDGVNVIIFPGRYRGHDRYESSRGTVFDHVAFRVDRLQPVLEAMKRDGVRVLSKKRKAVIVEGPDRVAVEVLEP